jgi:peptidoglycan/xylan/chitin deacetylase (PgdA/CDA1 family)
MFFFTIFIILVLIILLAYVIYKPPHLVVSFLQWRNPEVLWHVPMPSSSQVVALTIDDAPSDQTARMLDLLKVYGAKATFFVIGSQIASHPDLLQRMHDEGHEIGNHAWRDEPSISIPLSELERQVREVETVIPANTGSKKYFRPGSGFFNKQMVDRVMALGYRVVLGSIYPHDPQIHNARINSKHVLSMLRSGGIIIMHDRRTYSADQLELILRGMVAMEWKAESLGGLLKIADDMKDKNGER